MTLDEFKKNCDDHMFWCYGTSEIFQRRERALKWRRVWITYLGILGPIALGSTVGAFGTDWKIGSKEVLPYLIAVAAVVGIVQFVLSMWALVARWDESYSAYQDAVRGNSALYNQFRFARDTVTQDFDQVFKPLSDEFIRQDAHDLRLSVSDKEKRYANHVALKYVCKPCRTCHTIPTGKPSDCLSCGSW